MSRSKLSNEQKVMVSILYQSGRYTQDNLAWLYRVHARTIRRCLREKGIQRRYLRTVARKAAEVPPVPFVDATPNYYSTLPQIELEASQG